MCTQKDLLGDVLSEGMVADEMHHVTPDRPLHLTHETLERGDIARGCRHDICGIWSVHVLAPRASDRIIIQRLVRILPFLSDVSDFEPSIERRRQLEFRSSGVSVNDRRVRVVCSGAATRRKVRRLPTVSVLALALLGITTPAVFGGGAVWEFEGYHRPGDIVQSTTAVAWSRSASLGTPEDGPYLIYLARLEPDTEDWSRTPEDGLLVGIVEVHIGPFTDAGGDSYGPNHAEARFEIPDVPPGSYQILHCNDPCTTTLGDIIGGWDLRVLSGPDGRSADEIAAEVRARIPTAPLVILEESTTTATTERPATASAEGEAPVSTKQPAREEVEPGAADEPGSVPANDPIESGQGLAQFDSLWMVIVGILSLLLVVRMIRTDSGWRLRSQAEPIAGNASRSTDVLTDE